MKKKLSIIIIILIILFIILGLIFGIGKLMKEYKMDQKNTKIIFDKILIESKEFESEIDPYNKDLKEIIELLNNSSYYEEMNDNKEKIVKLLDKISLTVEKLSSYDNLNNNCKRTYADGKVNRACSSFSKTYEKSINIYVDVIKAYNNLIEKVNEINSSDKNKIPDYKGFANEYIDYNSDGEFLGKELILDKKGVTNNG